MAARKPSWQEFYRILTENAQANSLARSSGMPIQQIAGLNYAATVGEKSGKGPLSSRGPAGMPASPLWMISPVAGIIGDTLNGNPKSAGSRIMDILSRGTYASANYVGKLTEQMQAEGGSPLQPNIFDPEALKAGWEGLSGQSKKTYSDVLGEQGMGKGIGRGIAGFLLDVGADPTTYIGPGAIKAAAGGLSKGAALATGRKAIMGADEAITDFRPVLEGKIVGDNALGAAPERLQLPAGPTREAPLAPEGTGFINGQGNTQSLDDFLRYLDSREGRAQQGMPGDVFGETPIPKTSPVGEGLAGPAVDTPRIFNVGPTGVADETRQLPAPPAELLATRARLDKLNEIVTGQHQWNYSDAQMEGIPQEGWFRENVIKRPITEPSPPSERGAFYDFMKDAGLESEHAKQQRAIREKYAWLAEQGNPDLENIKNPTARLIMSRVDEPVYPSYHPKQITVSGGKGGTRTETVWMPNSDDLRDGNFMSMGELRTKLMDPRTRPEVRKALGERLFNHIQAVKQYAESKPSGFAGTRGPDTFWKEMYGATPKEVDALAAKNAMPDFPEGPFKPEPKYEEIRTWEKIDDPTTKAAYLNTLAEKFGISRAEIVYLSKASNRASFETRLENIIWGVRQNKDVADFVDAIANGRITKYDIKDYEPALKLYGVKTFAQLKKAVERDLAGKAKGEKGFIEGAVESRNLKMGQTVKQKGIRETGPGGAEYRSFNTAVTPRGRRVQAQAEQAIREAQRPTAAKIVEKVKTTGDKSDLVEHVNQLNDTQQGMVARALNSATIKNIINPKKWKYETDVTHAKRTHKTPGKGNARHQDTWGAGPQYDIFKSLISDFSKQFSKARSQGKFAGLDPKDVANVRADMAYDTIMPVMEHIGRFMREHGVWATLGKQNTATPVGMWDVFDVMDPFWIKRNLFKTAVNGEGRSSIVAPGQLMDAIDIGVTARRAGEESNDYLRELIWNHMVDSKLPNRVKNVVKGETEYEDFMGPIMDAVDELAVRAEKYDAARQLYHDNQVSKGTQAALDEIAKVVTAPDSTFTKAMAMSNTLDSSLFPKVARLHNIDPLDEFMVSQEVRSVLPNMGLTPEVQAAAKEADEMAKAEGNLRVDLGVNRMKQAMDDVKGLAEEQGIPLNELGTQVFENAFFQKLINGIFPHVGNQQLRPMFLDHKSFTQSVAHMYHSVLNDIALHSNKGDISSAFNLLQAGKWSPDPQIAKVQEGINKAIMVMFSEDPNYSMFARNGLTAEEMNAHFKHFGIPEQFHFDSKKSLHDQWKEWNVKDPLDTLSKMFAASTAVLGKKLMGDQLMAEFGSKVKHPGYVKLARTKNEILRYVDTESYYFPKEIAGQMKILDDFLTKTMEAGPSHPFWRGYDSVLHSLKTGLTIYRLGHHVRNMVGDMWLTNMAGVNRLDIYPKAFRIIAQNRGAYKDFDALAALVRAEKIDPSTPKSAVAQMLAADANKPMAHITVNGKKVPVTSQEIYRKAFDNGLLTDYSILEDVRYGGDDAAMRGENFFDTLKLGDTAKRIRAPFGGKVHNAAATFSEARDHAVRLAHLIAYIEKGNFKSLDEAFTRGTHEVRKWHPDGSDLSHFEQKAMRRLIMFYSWVRKAIPLIAEGMVTRPGKAMIYPKFMYNMAEAQGIDLDSLSDPFPTDQLFPSWITDGLQGPAFENDQGQYFGINPGIPMLDVLGDYASTDPKALAGNLSPLFKIPMEVLGSPEGAVAEDARTHVPIFDKSDYLDKQIPNANLWTSATGKSLTQPWQSVGGAERNKEGDPERTILNFLSGLGLYPMSKPAYIKQAKKEQNQRSN